MRSGNSLVRTRAAALWKSVPSVLPLALTLSISTLITSSGFASQTASSSASQAGINEEAQAAYRAGTAAAANNDFKTAEAQFEKVVRLVPQIEEGHSALGAVLMRLGKFPASNQRTGKGARAEARRRFRARPISLGVRADGCQQEGGRFIRGSGSRGGSASLVRIPLPHCPRMFLRPMLARSLPRARLPAATAKMKARRRRVAAERRSP